MKKKISPIVVVITILVAIAAIYGVYNWSTRVPVISMEDAKRSMQQLKQSRPTNAPAASATTPAPKTKTNP